MKAFALLATLAFGFAIIGCSSTPATEEAANTKPVATAEVAKCDGCSKEVPKAELVSHDGKMMCKACMDAHQH